jgi:hypothetical protein
LSSNTGSTGGRFAKGQSGNPRGRPRKTQATPAPSAFDIILERTLTLKQDGVVRQVTVDEALQQKIYQDAIAGSRLAARTILRMIAKREKARAVKKVQLNKIDIRIQHADRGDADEALRVLGIASIDEERTANNSKHTHMLIERWAMEAALTRRRAGFEKQKLADAKRMTRDTELVRWPEPDRQ